MMTAVSVATILLDKADSHLAQCRAALRLQGARKAWDVLLNDCADGLTYRLTASDSHGKREGDGAASETHYVDQIEGDRPFSLTVLEGDLLFSVHETGFGRVAGGLPALESALGPVTAAEHGSWRIRLSKPAQARSLCRLLFSGQPAAAASTRHWWVNHADGYRHQIDGGYLWAPKKAGARQRSASQHMIRVVAGDLVFSRVDDQIVAIGIALDRARSAPDPATSGTDGWLLPVRLVELNEPLRLAHSAGQASGAYLAGISDRTAQGLRRLLCRQVEDLEQRISAETEGRLMERALEDRIWQRADIDARSKRQLSHARLGQGSFRANVERIETACRVTGILDRRYLQATHIKPWKDADDREKLDGANGLLLSPHIIHLFDRGHISFADDGMLMISRHLNPYVRTAWGLERPAAARAFRPEQTVYLHYHRDTIFERIGGGRRSPAQPAVSQR